MYKVLSQNSVQIGNGTSPSIDQSFNSKLTIPNFISGKPVTILGPSSFFECNHTEISIPDSIVEIGSLCFFSSKLKLINIPKSVKIIRANALQSSKIINIDLSLTNSSYLLEKFFLPYQV